ncbi:carbohydrate-binding protein [Cystobacter fuscus]|uniref:Carbohydrate-binding protein n=1 Tax=Cystobacter fuscus TaxID=43 RepID=A0A250J9W1_9BACT|nr:polysaccharide lyase [Cystobacter fuscus]ATB40348.1 carbohydrate-binding protein [Cystobacter fuscus]
MKRIGMVALLLTLPLVALASPVWKGDFESGDLSQWTGKQEVASDRLQVVSSPDRQSQYALKVTVRKGDDPINASGNRNELFHYGNETEGSEYYYKWSTMFAPDFPSANTWQLFTQWHQDGTSGSPPLEFYAWGENIYLRLEGRDDRVVWSAPLVRDQWLDFVLHVKWSSDPEVGFVELYYNGELALPQEFTPTLFGGMQNYLKQGLYRDESIDSVGVVFHSGMEQATSLEDVFPTVAGAPGPSSTSPQTPGMGSQAPSSMNPGAEMPGDLVDPAVGCSASGGSVGGLGLFAALALWGGRIFKRRARGGS